MNIGLRIACLSSFPLLMLLTLPSPAIGSDTHSSSARLAGELDAYMKAQVSATDFSGAVLVAKNDHILFSRGYGQANREWDLPNDTHTKFRIGSLTKQFTATLIMQLRERHQLEVQDKICKYLDPCPDAWQFITIRELLSHTAGIPNFTDDPDFQLSDTVPRTVEELIVLFRDKPLEFAPGTDWKYSNSGYVLLGAIIERVTRKSFEEVLQEQIIRPVGMNESGYDHHSTILKHRAAGYSTKDGILVNAAYLESSWAYAAGAMYSTALDLYKWDRALYSNAVLPQSALREMWTPVRGDYGYGWGVVQSGSSSRKRLELTHEGGIDGFRSHISRFPNDGAVVIVLTNTEEDAGPVGTALAAIVFGEPYLNPARVNGAINPSAFDQFVGDYGVEGNGIARITRIGNSLHIQLMGIPGEPTFKATPQSTHRVRVDDLDADIDFIPGADPNSARIIVRTVGKPPRHGRKLGAPPAPASP